jgi:hypothetical protein
LQKPPAFFLQRKIVGTVPDKPLPGYFLSAIAGFTRRAGG